MIALEKKAKLTWNCRRGMLELDLILQRFLAGHLDQLNSTQLSAFERLLMASDPDLYAWLMGYETCVDKELRDIVDFIRACDHLK